VKAITRLHCLNSPLVRYSLDGQSAQGARSSVFCLSMGFETDQLGELKQKGTYFKLRVLEDEQAPVPTFDGKKVINLASNNWLGLTTLPKPCEAALDEVPKYVWGNKLVHNSYTWMYAIETAASTKGSLWRTAAQTAWRRRTHCVNAVIGSLKVLDCNS
jgi:hypothetical protein